MNTHTTQKTALTKTSARAASIMGATFAGITLPELAVLGAAGYVAWKNREKIASFLEERGIDVPEIFTTKDFSALIPAAVALAAGHSSEGAEDEEEEEDETPSTSRRARKLHA